MILKSTIFLLFFSAVEVFCDYKSSLTFVIDDTGSMGDDIDQVKSGANDIFDTVLNSDESQIEDFVLVTFNDPETQLRTITQDRGVFKKALSEIFVGGGGDCPEYCISGIMEGVKNSRFGSTVYVFTDASAKDYSKYEEVKHMALKKQIQVVFVLTGMCPGSGESSPDYKVYKKLAKDTDGEIFHLEKNEIGKILTYVMENVKGRRTPLAVADFPAGTHSLNFTVDKHSNDVTISVTGNKINLKVIKPDGDEVNTKSIVNLDNIRINKILNSKPGEYIVEVSSGSDSHAHVSARTDIIFQHGFSTFEPSSIKDTTTTPLPDEKSHISIQLNDGSFALDSVQILDMDDNLIKEVPLVSHNDLENFYTTELEDLPDTMFKLAIVGHDLGSDKDIRRIGSPIAPQPKPKKDDILNKAPSVTILGPATQKVQWKQPFQLKCNVNGYPQPNIIWLNKDTGKKMPATSTSVYAVELPYDFISVLNVDNLLKDTSYECKADNSLGSDSASVAIQFNAKPYFVVLREPEDTLINYHDKGELYCQVDAFPPATITWYKDRKVLLKNDNIEFSDDNSVMKIKEMRLSDQGPYVCEVRNPDNTYLFGAQVTVTGAERPVIDDHVKDMTVQAGTDVTIRCNILKGMPKPSVIWYFSDAFSGEDVELPKWKDQQSIMINNVKRKNAGTYSCKAENEFGSDYHEILLTVEYPVEIKEDEKDIRVAEGKSIMIPCSVTGKPDPKVTWYKDDVRLSAGHNIFIYKDHTIKMTVAVSDSGTYTCVATNKFGTVSKAVKIDVYVPATIIIPEETQIEVLKGSSLDLPCQAKGNPIPETEWVLYSFNPKVPPKSMQKSVGASVINLKNIQLEEAGFYTCIARNPASTTNITFEIHVVASPKIENQYIDNIFKAVEGDLALMIKCKASGNPPPVIRWLKNKNWFASDFIIEDGTFVLKNVSKNDSGIYVCDARNRIGFDRKTYQVVVDKAPEPGTPTSTVVIAEGATASVRCDVPHRRTDQLRWYKNGVLIRSRELTLTNAKTSDSGLYTCRVSGFTNSSSGNTLVMVGQKPKFTTDKIENINIDDGLNQNLNCEAIGDPKPQIRWWHNGEMIETTDHLLYLEIEAGVPQGQYVCEAKNEFGSVIRHFNITSSDCFIDLKTYTSKLQPLMLSPSIQWPESAVKNGYVYIPKNSYVNLFCPNHFKAFPNRHNWAFCEGGTRLKIQGKTFDYSDIECTEEVTHFVKSTEETCLYDNTELFKVVFRIKSDTVEAYDVCFDNFNNKPLYTTLRMTSSVADVDYFESEWANKDLFDLDFDEAYKCSRQNMSFTRDDGCCFGKRMLVNPKDLFPGVVAQKSAYSYLNAVPQWSTCNTNYNNWNEVEQRVRSLAKTTFSDLIVSTGVAEDLDVFISDQHNNRQAVPKFLWKVVQEEATESSLVIIQVNMPDLLPGEAATQVLCRDICHTTEWMKGSNWYDTRRGFIYCCSLKDFEDSFNYKGVFLPYYDVLSDVTALPDFSLV